MDAKAVAVESQQLKNAEVPGLPTDRISTSAPVPSITSPPSMPGKRIVIKRATFGDESSATDVTKTLTDQLDEKGYVDVTADSSLVPLINIGGPKKVSLTPQEMDEAQKQAVEECGGGQNKSCVDARQQQRMQLMLKEKENKTVAADKVVKGRRLTVTYIDESGREQTVLIPDGNAFKAGEPPEKKQEEKSGVFSINPVLANVLVYGTTFVVVIGWVYSIVATYRTLLEAGYRWIGFAATAVAIFIPYSGFLIMFGFFVITSFMGKNTDKLPTPALIQSIARRPGATVSSVISQ